MVADGGGDVIAAVQKNKPPTIWEFLISKTSNSAVCYKILPNSCTYTYIFMYVYVAISTDLMCPDSKCIFIFPILISISTVLFQTPFPINNSISTIPRRISCSRTMASNNEESMSRRLWSKFRNDSILALYTPFVVALAAGNLEADTLRNFFSQGIYFLKCYAKSLTLAEKCADNDDAKTSINQFKKNFLNLIQTHNFLVEKWGSDYTEEYEVNPATDKCTKFVFGIASEKRITSEKAKVGAYTLGAMLPHIQLYTFICKELQSLPDVNGNSHPFKKWIDYYSSKYYQVFTLEAEDLLDKLSVSLTRDDVDIIKNFYHQAMVLELESFSAQPMVQKTVVPLLKEHDPLKHHFMVFSDFDSMCTVVDPAAIFAKIGIGKAPESDLRKKGGLFSREYTKYFEQCIVKCLNAEYEQCILKLIVADLITECKQCILKLLVAENEQYIDNISLAEEGSIVDTEEYERCKLNKLFSEEAEKFDYTVLKKALEQLSEFGKRANTRVIESDQLKALYLLDNKRPGARHILQDGCQYLLQSISVDENISASIHVLSYRWSYDLMKSVFSSVNLHTLGIHENEVVYEECISTREIIRKVESPIERVERFRNIHQKSASGKKKLIVYIGQSVGELLCLLEADIGIVVGSCESLRRVGSHFGVSFVPLFHALVEKQKEMVEGGKSCDWTGGLSGVLYTVSCWDEVHFLIVGS